MRVEGGIREFTEASEMYTMGELNQKDEEDDSRKKLKNLEITCVERFNGHLLKKEDFFVYPRGLSLFK